MHLSRVPDRVIAGHASLDDGQHSARRVRRSRCARAASIGERHRSSRGLGNRSIRAVARRQGGPGDSSSATRADPGADARRAHRPGASVDVFPHVYRSRDAVARATRRCSGPPWCTPRPERCCSRRRLLAVCGRSPVCERPFHLTVDHGRRRAGHPGSVAHRRLHCDPGSTHVRHRGAVAGHHARPGRSSTRGRCRRRRTRRPRRPWT